jgi:hypothetical protein
VLFARALDLDDATSMPFARRVVTDEGVSGTNGSTLLARSRCARLSEALERKVRLKRNFRAHGAHMALTRHSARLERVVLYELLHQ